MKYGLRNMDAFIRFSIINSGTLQPYLSCKSYVAE